MPRGRLSWISLLALACALTFVPSASAETQFGQASGDRASQSQPGGDRAYLRGGSRARKAAQRRKARSAQRRQRARRRLLRRQKRRAQRGIGNQVALTRKARKRGENPDVLFRGDFESGFDGWHVQSLSSRANLFSSGAFQGGGAARFEVQAGDVEPETGSQRSEVSGPTFNEGQDLYFRDAIRIPGASSYDGPWQIIQQLHEENWGGSPGIAVFLDADNALRIGSGDGDITFWESQRLSRDRWHDLVYRVYLSQDESSGFVEVWLNGVQQTLENGASRAYGRTIQTPQTYLKAGIYRSRSSSGTSLVEHDAIVVGTSLAAVTAG